MESQVIKLTEKVVVLNLLDGESVSENQYA